MAARCTGLLRRQLIRSGFISTACHPPGFGQQVQRAFANSVLLNATADHGREQTPLPAAPFLRSSSPARQQIQGHSVCKDNRVITVQWADNTASRYPFIFLRDCCECPSCYDHSSQQRMLETVFNVNMTTIAPDKVVVDAKSQELWINWNDGHTSKYHSDWLQKRRLPQSVKDIKRYGHHYPPSTWGAELNGNIPTFDFRDLARDEAVLLSWLETLASKGVALVTNAKAEIGQLAELQECIGGFARKTNYGETFVVKSKPNPSNLAYTGGTLLLHIDLLFYELQPGIQILHFVKQSVAYGGENHLVDGFNVVTQLKKEQPEMFDLLTKYNLVYYDIGHDQYGEFHLENERPAIGLDRFGNLDSVGMNNHARGSFINAPAEIVTQFYEAMYAMYDIAYRPENLVTHKCQEGNMLTFNNRRVMHGRAAYSQDVGERLLEGCYFDWDQAHSVIRCIRKRMGLEV